MTWKLVKLLLLTIVLGGLAFSTPYLLNYSGTHLAGEGEADRLAEYLLQQEQKLQAYSQKGDLVFRQLLGFGVDNPDFSLTSEEISNLQQEEFTLYLFRKDSLVFWNNQRASPPPDPASPLLRDKLEGKWFEQDGKNSYATWMRTGRHPEEGPFVWMARIPLQLYNSNTGSFRETSKKPYYNTLSLSNEKSPWPVTWSDGEILCYATTNPIRHPHAYHWLIAGMFLPFLFVAGVFLTTLSHLISEKAYPATGGIFLLFSIGLLRFLSYWLDLLELFSNLPLFRETYSIPFFESPADFIINNILILWFVLFLHGISDSKNGAQRPQILFLRVVSNYLTLFFSLSLVTLLLQYLLHQGGISFAGPSPFDLDWTKWVVLSSLVLLLLAFFLWGFRLLLFVEKTAMPLESRIIAAFLSLLLFALIAFFTAPERFFPVYVIPASILFILLFELVRNTGMGLNFFWFLFWIFFLSSFSSYLIWNFDKQLVAPIQKELAETLLPVRDSLAEVEIQQLTATLKDDPQLKKIVQEQSDSVEIQPPVIQYLKRIIQKNKYLHHYYLHEALLYKYALPTNDLNPVSKPDTTRLPLARQVVISFPDLRFGYNQSDYPVYRTEIEIDSPQANTVRKLLIDFKLRPHSASRLKADWLNPPSFRGLKNIRDFDYFVYGPSGTPIIQSEELPFNLPSFNTIPPNQAIDLPYAGGTLTIFRTDDGSVSIVKGKQNNLYHFISLTAAIFALILLQIVLLNTLNLLVKILPEQLNQVLAGPSSMRKRIQNAFIWMTITFFVITGATTIWYFNENSLANNQMRLNQKKNAVMENLRIQMETNKSLENLLQGIPALSSVHDVNIQLFDKNGRLIRHSEYELQADQAANLMNPTAFHFLARRRGSEITLNESWRNLQFRTAYETILGGQNNDQILGFIGIPFYSEKREMQSELTQFLGTLLNLYAGLFLIAAAVSVSFTNNLTDGITQIGEKMKSFRLGENVEFLEWKRNDEMGALVNTFNRMVENVNKGVARVTQAEREAAWREMAKQVAHEIKNPLTPMRLLVQHLSRLYEADPENLEKTLKSTSRSLIEQIESLAQIANEFSEFAKMPEPVNERVELNQLVESVANLFDDQKNADFYTYLPTQPLASLVDKKQLVRVLNNLIKNALQAVPKDRRGDISINLFERDDMAVIMVTDNGEGIPDDKQDKVFNPYFTTKSSGKGLGLAIARNVVTAANGKIYFETETGKGTRFFVELPLLHPDSAHLNEINTPSS